MENNSISQSEKLETNSGAENQKSEIVNAESADTRPTPASAPYAEETDKNQDSQIQKPEQSTSQKKEGGLDQSRQKDKKRTIRRLTFTAMVAALYVAVMLPVGAIGYSLIQIRPAEVFNILSLYSFSSVPGLFIGCLIANILNPANLGLVDILGGSATTLLAGVATWFLGIPYRKRRANRLKEAQLKGEPLKSTWRDWVYRVVALAPQVILNALIVGSYLPRLLLDHIPTSLELIGSIASLLISQSLVIYGLGLPLILLIEKIKLPLEDL